MKFRIGRRAGSVRNGWRSAGAATYSRELALPKGSIRKLYIATRLRMQNI